MRWDRVVAFGLIGLGVLAAILGWRGVTDSPFVVEELSYLISGGIGGVLMLAVGTALLVNSDLRDEFTALDRAEAALRASSAPPDVLSTNGKRAEPAL